MSIRHRAAAALLLAALSSTLSSTAYAHAELRTTDPAADEILETAPTEVVMTFEGELDSDASEFVVTGADGGEVGRGGVDLLVADRNVMRGDVSITSDGGYTVEWIATSVDGHAVEGTFGFVVGGSEGWGERPPDTAVTTGPAGSARAVIGGLLLVLAAALVRRSSSVRR